LFWLKRFFSNESPQLGWIIRDCSDETEYNTHKFIQPNLQVLMVESPEVVVNFDIKKRLTFQQVHQKCIQKNIAEFDLVWFFPTCFDSRVLVFTSV